MQIQFGESVRRLRQEKGLTQEALAAQLHVSFQTISKWERNESHPDLTMLPVLAQFFGVRTDDLLGVNQAENERRVQEIIANYESNKTNPEQLEKLKAAITEHPLDHRLLVRYMECRLMCARGYEGGLEVNNEVREIYENIDTHCTDDHIRMGAKRLFSMYLHSLAQKGEMQHQKEAEQILTQMPSMRTCREHLAIMINLPGEAHLRAVQRKIVELAWMFTHAVAHHDVYGKAFPGEEATHAHAADIIFAQEYVLRLLAFIYPDGDYGQTAIQLIYTHGYLAFYNAILGEFDKAFEHMAQSLAMARAFDTQPQVVTHTSPLLRGLPYDKTPHEQGIVRVERMRELFGERYPWPEGFRENPRFAELMEGLERNSLSGQT